MGKYFLECLIQTHRDTWTDRQSQSHIYTQTYTDTHPDRWHFREGVRHHETQGIPKIVQKKEPTALTLCSHSRRYYPAPNFHNRLNIQINNFYKDDVTERNINTYHGITPSVWKIKMSNEMEEYESESENSKYISNWFNGFLVGMSGSVYKVAVLCFPWFQKRVRSLLTSFRKRCITPSNRSFLRHTILQKDHTKNSSTPSKEFRFKVKKSWSWKTPKTVKKSLKLKKKQAS